MKDFLKIFVILCLLVGAFMYGRNYGELTYRESEEYKTLVKAKEDLTFAKADLENVKAKFQNILDGSGSKKQEELLAQILQVFLVDLGLRAADNQPSTSAAKLPPVAAPIQAEPKIKSDTTNVVKSEFVPKVPKE